MGLESLVTISALLASPPRSPGAYRTEICFTEKVMDVETERGCWKQPGKSLWRCEQSPHCQLRVLLCLPKNPVSTQKPASFQGKLHLLILLCPIWTPSHLRKATALEMQTAIITIMDICVLPISSAGLGVPPCWAQCSPTTNTSLPQTLQDSVFLLVWAGLNIFFLPVPLH